MDESIGTRPTSASKRAIDALFWIGVSGAISGRGLSELAAAGPALRNALLNALPDEVLESPRWVIDPDGRTALLPSKLCPDRALKRCWKKPSSAT